MSATTVQQTNNIGQLTNQIGRADLFLWSSCICLPYFASGRCDLSAHGMGPLCVIHVAFRCHVVVI